MYNRKKKAREDQKKLDEAKAALEAERLAYEQKMADDAKMRQMEDQRRAKAAADERLRIEQERYVNIFFIITILTIRPRFGLSEVFQFRYTCNSVLLLDY